MNEGDMHTEEDKKQMKAKSKKKPRRIMLIGPGY